MKHNSDKMTIAPMSSQPCSKPNVVCIPFSSVCDNVSLCHPAEWLRCVGQGRLLDRLASVLWVCAPDHVPDLQRWLVIVVLSLDLFDRMQKVLVCVKQLLSYTVILSVDTQKVFVNTVTLATNTQKVFVCIVTLYVCIETLNAYTQTL